MLLEWKHISNQQKDYILFAFSVLKESQQTNKKRLHSSSDPINTLPTRVTAITPDFKKKRAQNWELRKVKPLDRCLVLKVHKSVSVPGMVNKCWLIYQQVLQWVGGSWVNESHQCVKDTDTHVQCVNNSSPPSNQLTGCYRVGNVDIPAHKDYTKAANLPLWTFHTTSFIRSALT